MLRSAGQSVCAHARAQRQADVVRNELGIALLHGQLAAVDPNRSAEGGTRVFHLRYIISGIVRQVRKRRVALDDQPGALRALFGVDIQRASDVVDARINRHRGILAQDQLHFSRINQRADFYISAGHIGLAVHKERDAVGIV